MFDHQPCRSREGAGSFPDDQDDPRDEDMDADEFDDTDGSDDGDDDEPGAYCPACGAGVYEMANRCPSCERDITPTSRPPQRSARSVLIPAALIVLLAAALLFPVGGYVCR